MTQSMHVSARNTRTARRRARQRGTEAKHRTHSTHVAVRLNPNARRRARRRDAERSAPATPCSPNATSTTGVGNCASSHGTRFPPVLGSWGECLGTAAKGPAYVRAGALNRGRAPPLMPEPALSAKSSVCMAQCLTMHPRSSAGKKHQEPWRSPSQKTSPTPFQFTSCATPLSRASWFLRCAGALNHRPQALPLRLSRLKNG